MFHKAISLEYKEDTKLELTFADGKVIQYDMRFLFAKYPQLKALEDRKLFLSGKLTGYGIIWNDELDIETETIYEEGLLKRITRLAKYQSVGNAVSAARAQKGLSQIELSRLTGIDQSDISRIERGIANPSVGTLTRIAEALGTDLIISFI